MLGPTCGGALAQLLLPALGAVLTEQLVVAHQQLHRRELVQAGLDGALFGGRSVTVGQGLEGPLVVVVVELVSALDVHQLFRGTVARRRRVPRRRREAQVDFRNRGDQLLHGAALLSGSR